MPLYMDIHEVEGATAEDVGRAHDADVAVQQEHGVEYHKYWFNQTSGKIFCICSAPSREAAALVHEKAHGLMAGKIIEVDPDVAEGFLGGCEVNSAGAALVPGAHAGERDSGTRTIMFTDIVDSTMITQRLGDLAAMQMVRAHDRVVRDALRSLNGREVKHMGDGIMASFVSAVAAVRAAILIQQGLEQMGQSQDAPVQVRIGVAAGEPVEQNQDLFGSTVQLAARLCSSAEPMQSLASNTVAELCLGKGLSFDDRGEYQLKGFTQPVRVHAIRPN